MPSRETSILILAAGLGSRLRPLTLQMPKPLVPVVDASILEHQARLARTLPGLNLHVNAHYLADKLKTAAEAIGFSKVWVEFPDILGTGGPLHRLYAAGCRGDFLVMNGDCYCHFDIQKFVENARASLAPFALLGVDFPKVNSLRVDANNTLCGVAPHFGASEALYSATFSGISWYSEEALSEIRAEERDVVQFWKRMVHEGKAPFVDRSQMNALWIDMGSPQGLMRACQARLQELGVESWIHPEHPLAGDSAFRSRCEGSVIQKGAVVAPSATLKNTLLFEGCEVREQEYVQNEIRGLDFKWNL